MGVSYFALALQLFAVSTLLVSAPALGNPEIYGGAANSGPRSVGAVLANPSRAIEFGNITAGLYLTPNHTSTNIRLPGNEPTSNSKTNFFALPEGAIIYRVNKTIAVFAGIPIPGLSATIKTGGVPIPIFGQAPVVSLEAEGSLLRFEGGLAVKVNSKIALGLMLKYQNTKFDVIVRDETDQDVINFTGSAGLVQVKLGGSIKVSPKLRVFAASTVFDGSSQNFEFDLELGSNTPADSSPATDTGDPTIFKDATLGVQFKLNPKTIFFLEGTYEAPIKNPRFSLVDLAEEEVDAGPVFAVRGGGAMKVSSKLLVMGGGAFHPSGVGPGVAGESPTGYGIFDFSIPAITGEKVKPFWQVGAGVELKVGKKTQYYRKKSRGKKSRTVKKTRYRGSVSIGAAFRKTSVGIEAEGEQPAAYEKTDLLIPIGFKWRF